MSSFLWKLRAELKARESWSTEPQLLPSSDEIRLDEVTRIERALCAGRGHRWTITGEDVPIFNGGFALCSACGKFGPLPKHSPTEVSP